MCDRHSEKGLSGYFQRVVLLLDLRIHVPVPMPACQYHTNPADDFGIYLRPSAERNLHSDLAQLVEIDFSGSNLGLVAGLAEFGQHGAPRIDDHAVTVANSLLVVSASLGGGDNVRLCLNRACPQKDPPVCSACGNGEGGGKCDDVGSEASQGDAYFRESKLERVNNGT